MNNDSEIQQVFDRILSGDTAQFEVPDRKKYESIRVMLVTKLSRYKEVMDSIGFLADRVRNSGMGGSYDANTGIATFKLSAPRAKTTYKVTFITESSDGTNVR